MLVTIRNRVSLRNFFDVRTVARWQRPRWRSLCLGAELFSEVELSSSRLCGKRSIWSRHPCHGSRRIYESERKTDEGYHYAMLYNATQCSPARSGAVDRSTHLFRVIRKVVYIDTMADEIAIQTLDFQFCCFSRLDIIFKEVLAKRIVSSNGIPSSRRRIPI